LRITENGVIILPGFPIDWNIAEKGEVSSGDLGYHLVTREINSRSFEFYKGLTDHETRCSHFRSVRRHRRRCRCLRFVLSQPRHPQPPVRHRGDADPVLRTVSPDLPAAQPEKLVIRSGNR